MTGYVRADTSNNIADGNIINAADFDAEYDAIEAAFVKTTGHTHDGSDAEGAPITKVGPAQDVVVSSSTVLPKTTATMDLGSGALKFKDAHFSGTINGNLTGTVTGNATNVSGVVAVANGGTGVTSSTGTGSTVLSNSPTLVTPTLGTPASATLTNATGLPLTTGVTGTLPVGNGGTGAATLTANNVLLGNGASAVQVVAPGTNGNVLTSNGTTWVSSTPASGIPYPGAGIAVSTGSAWTTSKTSPSGTIVGTTDSQTLTNKTIEAGTFTNGYTEETYTANSSTAITLDLANGSFQIITLTGSATITMPTAVAGKSFILLLKSGAGSYTVTWSTVAWPSATAPTLTSTASKQDILSFFSDGVKWYGTTVGLNYTP